MTEPFTWVDDFTSDHFSGDRYLLPNLDRPGFQQRSGFTVGGGRLDLLPVEPRYVFWSDPTYAIPDDWAIATIWLKVGPPPVSDRYWSVQIGFRPLNPPGDGSNFPLFAVDANINESFGWMAIPPYSMQLGGAVGEFDWLPGHGPVLPYQSIYPPTATCPAWESFNQPVTLRLSLMAHGLAIFEIAAGDQPPHRSLYISDGAWGGDPAERFPGMTIAADMTPDLTALVSAGLCPFGFMSATLTDSGAIVSPPLYEWGYETFGGARAPSAITGALAGGPGARGQLRTREVN